MNNFGEFFSNVIAVIGILIAILLLIPLIPVANRWYQLAIVQSSSMEPRLAVGSLAIYREQSTYFPGEVIVYYSGDGEEEKIIIHRVVEKKTQDKKEVYFTQGDATQYFSPQPVFAWQVRGKLVGSISRLGYILNWFKSQVGIATAIFISLVLLILTELIKIL